MSEQIESSYITEIGSGQRIAVTTKQFGNNISQQLEVLGSMTTYVNCGMAMLHLCDRFETVSTVPGIDDKVATGITNTALECASVMWFCAGVDVNSDNKDARDFVAEWEKQLSRHNRKLMKSIRRLRNELHGHRGGRGDRGHKREVSVGLAYLFGDLGEPIVTFDAGADADNIKRLFERMSPQKRTELKGLMRNASDWLDARADKERNLVSNRVLGRKEDSDLVTVKGGRDGDRNWLDWSSGVDSLPRD